MNYIYKVVKSKLLYCDNSLLFWATLYKVYSTNQSQWSKRRPCQVLQLRRTI